MKVSRGEFRAARAQVICAIQQRSMQTRAHDECLDGWLTDCAERFKPVQSFNQDIGIAFRPNLNWRDLAIFNYVFGDNLHPVRFKRFRALGRHPDIRDGDIQFFQHGSVMNDLQRISQLCFEHRSNPASVIDRQRHKPVLLLLFSANLLRLPLAQR